LKFSILLLFLIVVVGIIGYSIIEDYALVDALYMTIITISTVGYREIVPLSNAGKIFTIILIISSFGIFAYAVSTITLHTIEGFFANYFRDNKLNKIIKKMNQHVIICGFGRNGKEAALSLAQKKIPFIIIEKEDKEIANISANFPNYPVIQGDASNEEVLKKAAPEKAKALITTLPIDADNLFIVLSAREFNKSMTIISRASDDHTDVKLQRAGADKVIMPDKIGGQRMAKLVTEPDTIEFLEYIINQSEQDITLAEIPCANMGNCTQNKTIQELNLRNKIGVNIIGIKSKEDAYVFNPSPDMKLLPDDKLFVLGTIEQIETFKQFLQHEL